MGTRRMVKDGVNFISSNKNQNDKPYFLYFNPIHAHYPLLCVGEFCNSSKRGLYGDIMNELHWAVGELVSHVRTTDNNTLLFMISDNGPALELCNGGGTAGGLKGGKLTTWDGGVRVPAIVWWPDRIPPNTVSSHVSSTLDVFPTIMDLVSNGTYSHAGDGESILAILLDNPQNHSTEGDHDRALYFYCGNLLMAIRMGKYKIHYRTLDNPWFLPGNCDAAGQPYEDILANYDCYDNTPQEPPLIFNMESDPGENYPLPANSPIFATLLHHFNTNVEKHESGLVKVGPLIGPERRPDLVPCCNPPYCLCGDSVMVDKGKDEL